MEGDGPLTEQVLITGGMGYVGGRITKYLLDHTDFKIRLTTRRSIEKIPDIYSSCEIVQMDLESDKDMYEACEDVQQIVHLAGMNEIDCAKDPESAVIVNSLGTLKLLKAAEFAGVNKFIYFSTAHVYGAPLQGKIDEFSLTRPVHPYAITHRVAEDFILSSHDRSTISGIVLRLSNSFGPPLFPEINRWSLLVNDLCKQAVTQGKLVLKSSGIQQRDFITLLDVCRTVHHFLILHKNKYSDGLFNVGGELSTSVIKMTELIQERCEKVFGFKPEIIKPAKKTDEIEADIDYRITKLKSTGFQLQGDPVSEIDAMLLFCQKEFSSKRDAKY